MPAHIRRFLGPVLCSLMGMLMAGCVSAPPLDPDAIEDYEEYTLRTQMLSTRARVEPIIGVAVPIEGEFDVGAMAGFKASLEAVEKGVFFGLRFDYANIESSDPVGPGTSQSDLLVAGTEQLMDDYTRLQVLVTFDYEFPMGTTPYSPAFRIGVGLGGVAISPDEAPGNQTFKFDTAYEFVAQPSLGFRFPFHEHLSAFLQAEYNFIPQIQLEGEDTSKVIDQDVDIGNRVEFSTINIVGGITFQW